MIQKNFKEDVIYHNTIDIWIHVCEEHNIDWSNTQLYISFLDYLKSLKIKLNPMNLCIKETGGLYERGLKKAKFLEELTKIKGTRPVYVVKYDMNLREAILAFISSIKKQDK